MSIQNDKFLYKTLYRIQCTHYAPEIEGDSFYSSFNTLKSTKPNTVFNCENKYFLKIKSLGKKKKKKKKVFNFFPERLHGVGISL